MLLRDDRCSIADHDLHGIAIGSFHVEHNLSAACRHHEGQSLESLQILIGSRGAVLGDLSGLLV